MTAMTLLHDNAVLALLGLASFLTLLDLGYHALKGLTNVLIEPGACFCPATIELLGKLTTILRLDLALLRSQIGFVADNDKRDRFGTLECCVRDELMGRRHGLAYHMIQNLVANDPHHLETLLAADAVDNHVSMDTNEVLAVEDSVFVLHCLSISMILVMLFYFYNGVFV